MTLTEAQFYLKIDFLMQLRGGFTHGDAWTPRLRSPSLLIAPDLDFFSQFSCLKVTYGEERSNFSQIIFFR